MSFFKLRPDATRTERLGLIDRIAAAALLNGQHQEALETIRRFCDESNFPGVCSQCNEVMTPEHAAMSSRDHSARNPHAVRALDGLS